MNELGPHPLNEDMLSHRRYTHTSAGWICLMVSTLVATASAKGVAVRPLKVGKYVVCDW